MQIRPKVGDSVLYWPPEEERSDIRHSATIAAVLGANLVNLGVLDANGLSYNKQNVTLVDIDEDVVRCQCEWPSEMKGPQVVVNENPSPVDIEETLMSLLERFNRLDEKAVEAGIYGTLPAAPEIDLESTKDITDGADESTDEVVTADDLVEIPPDDGAGDDMSEGVMEAGSQQEAS